MSTQFPKIFHIWPSEEWESHFECSPDTVMDDEDHKIAYVRIDVAQALFTALSNIKASSNMKGVKFSAFLTNQMNDALSNYEANS